MKRKLILIRHGQVHEKYQGICYGQSDIELNKLGQSQSLKVINEICKLPISVVYHSDLKRTRFLVDILVKKINVKVMADHRLRERNFGQWELQSWDQIHKQTKNKMNGFFEKPDSFAPPGGETTYAFRNRVMLWYDELPKSGTIAVAAHGGTIAVLLGTLKKLLVHQWLYLIPEYGSYVEYSE